MKNPVNTMTIVFLILVQAVFLQYAKGSSFPQPKFAKRETPQIKLKIRWEQKKEPGNPRIAIVFIKNEGSVDLLDEGVEILLKGKGEKERRWTKSTITVAENQEIGIAVPLDSNEAENKGEFFGIPLSMKDTIPIVEMKSVEITLRKDLKFTSS